MPQSENNFGVQTAASQPGRVGALGGVPDFGIVPDQVTVTGGIGSGTSFPAGQDPGLSQFGNPSLSGISGFDSSSLDTPSFDFGTGSGTGSSLLSSAISTLTGGSGLGNLAAIGGEAAAAAYGLSEAKKAQKDAQAQAQQILSPSQNYLNSSQQLLQQYFSKTLNPNDQKFVDFATKEGQDMVNSGQGMKAIADQQLGQFKSGDLLKADQLELDRNTAAAKQQLADSMAKSGTTDSSIAAGYNQQIDEAAQIQKQKILNGYFQTGNQAYNSWLTSTTQGAQLMQQGAQFSHQAFQDMLSSSLNLGQVGMSGLTTAIGLEIQSDNELSKDVSDLMANLASAFAYTIGGGAAGAGGAAGGGGGGGAGGTLNSLITLGKAGKSLYQGASSLFSGASTASTASTILAGGSAPVSAVGVDSVSELGSVSDSLGGFSSAGGAAAAGAGAAASGAVGEAGAAALGASGSFATGGGAAAASSAGAGAGAGAGLAAAAGPLAGAVLFYEAGMALGDAWTKKSSQGNVAMKGWMNATGAKWVPNKGQSNSGGNTFQSQQFSTANDPGTMYDKSGNPMTPAQASAAIAQWAKANGVNPGDFK